jgi:integrase
VANSKTRAVGHLKDLGSGRWLVRVSLGTDAKGRRVRYEKTVHGKKADAQRHLRGVLQRRDQGLPGKLSRDTLGEWSAEWLDKWCSRIAPRTKADYTVLFDRLFRYEPQLGGRRLADLTADELQGVVRRLEERGLAPRTIQMHHGVLRACLNKALKLGKVALNAATLVELPRKQRLERPFLAPAQALRFLDVGESQGNRFYPLFAVLLLTGIRPGEALALRWDDIEGNSLRIRRALVWIAGRKPFLDETKTRRARTVALGERVLKALERQRRAQAELRLLLGAAYEDRGLVFASETGAPLSAQNVSSRYFKPLLTAAGLPDVRLYDLRHSHATLLLAAGEHPKVVQERLGHATITLTLDTYSHVVPGMQERAAERLDALLASARPSETPLSA